MANSIAAVSGLRVASKALAELTRKNNLSGNVKTEAQDLAKLLRTSLGEDVLVAAARSVARTGAQASRPTTATARHARNPVPAPRATRSARSNNPR